MKYPCKNTFFSTLFAVLLFAFSSVSAQSTENEAAAETEVDPTAEVRVRQVGTTTVKEFHQQGKVYKVEVAPKNTPAYILSDQDGNGSLNSSDTSIDSDLVLPEWTLGNW